jgi:hypothetical protein
MIKAVGDKFYVMDSTGKKVLGKHSSKKKAIAQLQAIEISKHRNESRILRFSEYLSESLTTLEYHDQLNPDLWDGFELKDDVRQKLLEIGDEWSHWAKLPLHAIKDYIFVGGNANFNYTPQSDVDLHILIDSKVIADCPEFIEDYFNDKKDLWKLKHDISIYGHPVEIYAQDINNKIPENQGVYSLTKNEWLSRPVHLDIDIKNIADDAQAEELKTKIDSLLAQNADTTEVQELKDQIKAMRGQSISAKGEFGEGNLIFKELRNLGYLDKMNDYIELNRDKKLSL